MKCICKRGNSEFDDWCKKCRKNYMKAFLRWKWRCAGYFERHSAEYLEDKLQGLLDKIFGKVEGEE
jgi:hypothetical protein